MNLELKEEYSLQGRKSKEVSWKSMFKMLCCRRKHCFSAARPVHLKKRAQDLVILMYLFLEREIGQYKKIDTI